MKIVLILCSALCLLSSCRYMSLGPYKHYRLSNDEAVPASKVGGAPWRNKR